MRHEHIQDCYVPIQQPFTLLRNVKTEDLIKRLAIQLNTKSAIYPLNNQAELKNNHYVSVAQNVHILFLFYCLTKNDYACCYDYHEDIEER